MQKLIASILLLLYSTANFGLSVRLDYCGDEISDFALFSNEAGISECCAAMGPKEDCCNSEQVYLQESSDKIQFSSSTSLVSWAGMINPVVTVYAVKAPISINSTLAVESKAPPLNRRSQVLFSCFLI